VHPIERARTHTSECTTYGAFIAPTQRIRSQTRPRLTEDDLRCGASERCWRPVRVRSPLRSVTRAMRARAGGELLRSGEASRPELTSSENRPTRVGGEHVIFAIAVTSASASARVAVQRDGARAESAPGPHQQERHAVAAVVGVTMSAKLSPLTSASQWPRAGLTPTPVRLAAHSTPDAARGRTCPCLCRAATTRRPSEVWR